MLETIRLRKYLFSGLLVFIIIIFPTPIQAQFGDFGFGERPPVEKLSTKGYSLA